MGKIAGIFVILGVCLVSMTSQGYIHSEEELAELQKRHDEIQRTLDGFSKNLSGELPAKYRSLKKALDAYASAHANGELNSLGTGWADMVASAKESVLREFIDLFRKLDSKQFGQYSELDFKQKDAELNRIYQTLQKDEDLDSEVAAAVSRRGIKETQRSWIKYRDAWLAFAIIKFPTVSKDSLSAALTADRISRLKKIEKMY